MFLVFTFVGVFSYFYHIIVGRTLGTKIYGEFGALFSLSFFLQFILFKMINMMVARSVSKFKGQKRLKEIAVFHSAMMFYMLLAGMITFIIFLIFSTKIGEFLHMHSTIAIFLVDIIFFLCWLIPVNSGTMQGLQRFKDMALLNIVQATMKFIIGVGLIFLGFGLYGALGGIVIGTAISLIISFYLLRHIIIWPKLKLLSTILNSNDRRNFLYNVNLDIKNEMKETLRFIFPVFLTIICIAIPTNIDVVLVKHFFSAEITGLYTAVSVFGRIMFSLPIAIATVMYPKVVEAHTQKNETHIILNKSLIYTILPLGVAAVLFYFFPKFFLQLFFGREYVDAGSLLQIYSIFIFFFSINTIFVYNTLAKNRYSFIYLFTLLSAIEIGAILIFHDSIFFFIQIFLIMNIVLSIIGVIINYFTSNDSI